MNKSIKGTCYAIAFAVLNGCAAGGALYKNTPISDKNKAQLIVFRESQFKSGGACFQTFFDNNAFGTLANGGFLKKDIEPGEHKISLLDDKAVLNIDAKAGEQYFIKVDTEYSSFSSKPMCKPNAVFGNVGFIFCLLEVNAKNSIKILPKLKDSSEKRSCMNTQ